MWCFFWKKKIKYIRCKRFYGHVMIMNNKISQNFHNKLRCESIIDQNKIKSIFRSIKTQNKSVEKILWDFVIFLNIFFIVILFLGIMIIYCDLQLNREKIYFYFFIIKRVDNMDGYITSRIANPLFGGSYCWKKTNLYPNELSSIFANWEWKVTMKLNMQAAWNDLKAWGKRRGKDNTKTH